jgi:DnaK suppressor protein
MDKSVVEKYKKQLLGLREQILRSGMISNKEDLQVPSEELSDETDLANSVISQQVSFQIRAREIAKLRAIDMALEKISNGTFGHCEECGIEIGEKRLANQPWTELCIEHAEELEKISAQHAKTA